MKSDTVVFILLFLALQEAVRSSVGFGFDPILIMSLFAFMFIPIVLIYLGPLAIATFWYRASRKLDVRPFFILLLVLAVGMSIFNLWLEVGINSRSHFEGDRRASGDWGGWILGEEGGRPGAIIGHDKEVTAAGYRLRVAYYTLQALATMVAGAIAYYWQLYIGNRLQPESKRP